MQQGPASYQYPGHPAPGGEVHGEMPMPGAPAPGSMPPSGGLGNLGAAGDAVVDARRKKQEEMKRALEEQIAAKERQKKEAEALKRQEAQAVHAAQAHGTFAQSPAAQAPPAYHGMGPMGQAAPAAPGQVAPSQVFPGPAQGRLGEENGMDDRRKKQEAMKRALAEQIAEKERQKKEQEERRRLEEERENERIRREQAAEEARLEARRQEDEAKKKALAQQNERAAAEHNERAAAARREEEEPSAPLPPRRRARDTHNNSLEQFQPQLHQTAQPQANRSGLFGLPPSASGSPVPWEVQAHASESFQPFPGQMHQAHHVPQGPQGLQQDPHGPPVSDMLHGLMHQQQELYRHQQEALARLQDEADRLRQEKESAKQDLLNMKAQQVEEKEKEVKKLQRKLQRQMLLGNAEPFGMVPSVASTPKEMSSRSRVNDFYSKYESPEQPASSGGGPGFETEPYPSDADMAALRRESDLSAWPVAPVPWLQPEGPQVIASEPEAPKQGSIGDASLFEDSWGKALENTDQLEARLDQTEDLVKSKPQASQPATSGTVALQGTLIGESKFVIADCGGTFGATWRNLDEPKLAASHSKWTMEGGAAEAFAGKALLTGEASLAEETPDVREASLAGEGSLDGQTSFAGKAHLAAEASFSGVALDANTLRGESQYDGSISKDMRPSTEDSDDPVRLLEGVVNAIREARGESGSETLNSVPSKPSDLEPAEGEAQEWGNVLRHFGVDVTPDAGSVARKREPRRRPLSDGESLGSDTGTLDSGYPPRDRSSMPNTGTLQQDSLDLLQGTHASQTSSTSWITGLGTQRPVAKDDFAALAAATPEDFDAFLARLRAQPCEERDVRGRSPQGSAAPMSAKERAKFGSPTLRAAAGSLLDRPPSGQSQKSGRPGSGSSATSMNSGGALQDLRRRRKPKTAEDLLVHAEESTPRSMHATTPAPPLPREPGALQALRAERKHGT